MLESLRPADIWKHFGALCAIPRPSGHEAEAVGYVRDFASQYDLPMQQDAAGNVVVHKPSTQGLEQKNRVMLQCHLDMVPQAHSTIQHDFTRDPIRPVIEGDWVHAQGTTLGADNGIGAAIALAVLGDSTLIHGPLSALFTVEEEIGLIGASSLSADMLEADTVINLDGEAEGQLLVGCAGGTDVSAELPVDSEAVPEGWRGFRVSIDGLRGGHSGGDIDLGRGNSIKLIAAFLTAAAERFGVRLCTIEGGSARNAIPREAGGVGVIPETECASLISYSGEFQEAIRAQLGVADPDFSINVTTTDAPSRALAGDSCRRVLDVINAFPDGVLQMSEMHPGVVDTSNNLARVACSTHSSVRLESLVRSLAQRRMDHYAQLIEELVQRAGGKSRVDGSYPGWEPDGDSRVVRLMTEVHRRLYAKAADVKVIHAGLECGIIKSKRPSLDCVSCGPTIQFPHSPDERVKIDSVARFHGFLLDTLRSLAAA